MDELKYRKIGIGNKIVIVLHEWMSDHTNYNPLVPYLNVTDFSWIFVDLRGYGLSKEIRGEYNLDEACSDIKNLIFNLKIKDIYLIGHSMSSLITQKLALDLKEKVKKLILVTPISPTGIKMDESTKEKLLKNVKEENGIIEQVVESASKRYNNVWKNHRKELANNCSLLDAKLGYMNMYLSNDFSSEIKGLETDILIIVGKYDLPAFHKNSVKKHFTKYYPNFKLVEFMEAGHYPMIECPVFFANEIEKFLLSK